MRFESTILTNLLKHEAFCRKVLPYLKDEYFKEYADKTVFTLIEQFVDKYNSIPTKDVLKLELESVNGLKEIEYDASIKLLDEVYRGEPEANLDWLVEKSEQFCQDAAIHNAIMQSVEILSGNERIPFDKGMIPQLLADALAVTFDSNIGHDLFEHSDSRYEYYHKIEERFKFSIDWLNEQTGGGVPKKTLNVILSPMNAGKTLLMCSLAADYMRQGKNVVYITMEMAEERIAERIDVNLMNMPIEEIKLLDKRAFDKRIADAKKKTPGRLIIKEYPTAGAHVGHFKHLLNELKLKKKFKADVVIIDYMGICLSQRLKGNANANSYAIQKAISEEMRGMAVEQDLVLWSAVQTGRQGIGASDLGMEDMAESIGPAATADFVLAWIRTQELDDLSQAMMKIAKSRYGSTIGNTRSIVGIDYTRMQVHDIGESGAVSKSGYTDKRVVEDDEPLFDKSHKPSAGKFGSIKC